jgi:ABC-type transport system, involved in lipoprotein release, permease component
MSSHSSLFLARRFVGLDSGGGGEAPGRRYLRGAILGVALSIVPLVIVLIVADGMIEGITARYIEAGTYHLQAKPLEITGLSDLEDTAARIRQKLPGYSAFPEYQGYGIAIAGSKTTGVAIRAVDPAFLKDKGTAAYLEAKQGELDLGSSSQILLGDALAKSLGAKVGDTVSLVTQRQIFGGEKVRFIPKISVFKVRGIVTAGYRELDALWVFVSIKGSSRVFAEGASRAMVGIKVKEPFGDLEPARGKLLSLLPAEWDVVTWPEAERNVYKSFSTTRALLLLVMALVVAVAAINVSSALVMLVLERRRDIAILKSAGASPKLIGRAFVFAGLMTGGTGSLIGIALGSLIGWKINDVLAALEAAINACRRLWAFVSGAAAPTESFRILDPAYYIERIPVNIHPGELALVAAVGLALCFVASLMPARRASKLPPLEIFRKT